MQASELVRTHALRLLSHAPRREVVSLLDTLGRVLAEPVYADRDQPPFRRSTRDGFACRAEDLRNGAPLTVVGTIRAGDSGGLSTSPLLAGHAVEIMTGAPVPDGADCVAMLEHATLAAGRLKLNFGRSIQAGSNVVEVGVEARQGDVVIAPGVRMEPRHIGAAAACGYSELAVYVRPRIAVLATGDELVDLGRPILDHQIRNSNSYSLAAQIAASGAAPVRLPIVADDSTAIESAVRGAVDCDLLLLSGGVSAGKYDFVESALLSLGAEFLMTGALIQPGRPVVFGTLPVGKGHRYFFGLPGNPVSTLVTFTLFVRPLLAALSGIHSIGARFARARLTVDIDVKPGLTRFLPALLSSRNTRDGSGSLAGNGEGDEGGDEAGEIGAEVVAVPWHGSGDLSATAASNCFVVVPAELGHLGAGETVSILLD